MDTGLGNCVFHFTVVGDCLYYRRYFAVTGHIKMTKWVL